MGASELGVMIPIIAVGGFFAWMIALSPLGKALAERVRGSGRAVGEGAGAQQEVLAAVDQLRQEVAELAERVDFTERLIAQSRAEQQLPPPRR